MANNKELGQKVIRVLMTGPNLMTEKVINDMPRTFFEVHDYTTIVALITSELQRFADEVEKGVIGEEPNIANFDDMVKYHTLKEEHYYQHQSLSAIKKKWGLKSE